MFALTLWIVAGCGLGISSIYSRKKTKMALKKSLKMFTGMLPMMLAIIIVIGLTFALIPQTTINQVLGGYSIKGLILSGLLGSISLIPMFIAAPLVGSLAEQGAGVLSMAMFITTLNMVGFLTAPLEAEFFGWKLTIWRNGLAFVGALVVAFGTALVLG